MIFDISVQRAAKQADGGANQRASKPPKQIMEQPAGQLAKHLFPAAPRGAHIWPSSVGSASFSIRVSSLAAGLVPLGLLVSSLAVAGTRGVRLAARDRQCAGAGATGLRPRLECMPRHISTTHALVQRRTGGCSCGVAADVLVEQLGATLEQAEKA